VATLGCGPQTGPPSEDAAGDLFGTTTSSVFEVKKTGSSYGGRRQFECCDSCSVRLPKTTVIERVPALAIAAQPKRVGEMTA
jgi:hypothetical protein